MNRQTKSFFTTPFSLLIFCFILLVFSSFENCTNSPKQNKIVQNKIAQDTSAAIKYADGLFTFVETSNDFEKNISILDTLLKIRKSIYEINPSQENHIKIARTYYGLGYNYNSISNYLTAKKHYQSALDIINLCKDNKRIFAYTTALAGPQNQCGDFLETELLIENAFKSIQFTRKKDSLYLLLIALQRKSEIADYKKNQAGTFSIDSTIYDICSKIQNRDIDIESIYQNSILNLGVDYRIKKQYASAFSFLERAKSVFLQLAKKENEQSYILDIANANTEIAHTHFALKKYLQAIKNYQNSLKILEKGGFSNHRYATEAQLGISNCLFEQKKYREAFGAAEKAMKILVPDDSIQHAHAPQHYLTAVLAKIKCHKALDSNDLQNLLTDYEDADKLIAYIHQNYNSDKSKLDLTEKSLTLYEDAINTAVALHQQTKDIAYFDKAISFTERNKAVVLREALQDNRAKKYAGISEEKLQQERDLKIELAYSQKQIFDATTDSLKNVWRSKVFNLQANITKFNRDLFESNQKYHDLRYTNNNSLTVKEIQQNLQDKDKDKNKSLLVEYFLGEKKLYIFAVSKDKYQVYSKDLPSNLDTMLQNIRDAVGKDKEDPKDYLDNAYRLYQFLLAEPLADFNKNNEITRLRVIPDGELGHISFDYLCTKQPSSWFFYDNPNWLLEKYATSYLYSNALLKSDKMPTIPSKSVGFGLNYKNRSPFQELIHAPDEAESVANLTYGKAYTNANATLSLFKKEVPNASIIHLAMHGILDDKNPLNSALIFTQSPEGDRLSAMEIYSMQLKSGLAVLSACNTGNGKLQRGEGIMSLARAFAFAGCPSMMVSLWSIPEASTSEITKRFYENIKAGMPKDIALQQAKLAYLRDNKTESNNKKPNNWAASVIIGDIEPIEIGYPLGWKIIIALSILMLGLGFYYKIKKTQVA